MKKLRFAVPAICLVMTLCAAASLSASGWWDKPSEDKGKSAGKEDKAPAKASITQEELKAREAGAKEALEVLTQAYTRRNTEAFFQLVADDPYLNRADLQQTVATRFREHSQIELKLQTERTLLGEGMAIFQIHWQRRAVRQSDGQGVTAEGDGQLFFRTGESAQLVDISGDSPLSTPRNLFLSKQLSKP